MKEFCIFGIYLYLVKHRKTTAAVLSKKFDVSQRSIYRYIDAMSLNGVGVVTKSGKNGGIELVGENLLEGIMLSRAEKDCLSQFVKNGDNITEAKKIISKLI